jgi:hypothetical protein
MELSLGFGHSREHTTWVSFITLSSCFYHSFFFFFVWDGGEALIEFQRLSVFPCFFLSFFFENILLFLIYLI